MAKNPTANGVPPTEGPAPQRPLREYLHVTQFEGVDPALLVDSHGHSRFADETVDVCDGALRPGRASAGRNERGVVVPGIDPDAAPDQFVRGSHDASPLGEGKVPPATRGETRTSWITVVGLVLMS